MACVLGGQDYDDILFTAESRTLHFSAPRRSRRATGGMEYEQSFNISTLPDLVVEENETFVLQLSTNDASVEFLPQNAIVIIIDNDGKTTIIHIGNTAPVILILVPAVISFSGQTPSLTLEEGNSGEICIGVLDGATERDVELIATTQDGSAIGML